MNSARKNHIKIRFSRTNSRAFVLAGSVTIIAVLWIITREFQWFSWQLFKDFYHFFFLGVIGAITASATGAGGGVVFVPSFRMLGLDTTHIIATSFAIQCFGMTTGSLSWLRGYYSEKSGVERATQTEERRRLFAVIGWGAPSSIGGLWLIQYSGFHSPSSVELVFSLFSIIFGVIILAWTLGRSTEAAVGRISKGLTAGDKSTIAFGCFIGGIVTAWISVGVGEVIAILLILRGYSTVFAISAAVCISALTVLAGVPLHIMADNIVFEILLFAAPAAVIGGGVAKLIALWAGAKRLKIFFGFWILVIGLEYFVALLVSPA